MKAFLFCLGLLSTMLFVTVRLAHADHHLVEISQVVKFNDEICAIELNITASNQDGFVDADEMQLDGDSIADFSPVVDAGINDAGSNNDTNDNILLASESFDSAFELDADITFDDDVCLNIEEATSIAFVIDSDDDGTADDTVDEINPSDQTGFDDNSAIVRQSDDSLEVVDLSEDDPVTLTNNTGDQQEFNGDEVGDAGNSSTEVTSNNTCALHPVTMIQSVNADGIGISAIALGLLIIWRMVNAFHRN